MILSALPGQSLAQARRPPRRVKALAGPIIFSLCPPFLICISLWCGASLARCASLSVRSHRVSPPPEFSFSRSSGDRSGTVERPRATPRSPLRCPSCAAACPPGPRPRPPRKRPTRRSPRSARPRSAAPARRAPATTRRCRPAVRPRPARGAPGSTPGGSPPRWTRGQTQTAPTQPGGPAAPSPRWAPRPPPPRPPPPRPPPLRPAALAPPRRPPHPRLSSRTGDLRAGLWRARCAGPAGVFRVGGRLRRTRRGRGVSAAGGRAAALPLVLQAVIVPPGGRRGLLLARVAGEGVDLLVF